MMTDGATRLRGLQFWGAVAGGVDLAAYIAYQSPPRRIFRRGGLPVAVMIPTVLPGADRAWLKALRQGLPKYTHQLFLVEGLFHKAPGADGLGPLKGVTVGQGGNHHDPGVRVVF